MKHRSSPPSEMAGIPEREGENRRAGKHSTIGAPVVTLQGGWERRRSPVSSTKGSCFDYK